jgi:predicted helicase
VKKKGATPRLRYHRAPEMWRKGEKLEFIAKGEIPWQELTPDIKNTWLVPENADEYRKFAPIAQMFELHTNGIKTNRDAVVYDWDRDKLAERMQEFITDYNAEVYRHKADPDADWSDRVNWSRDLKQDAQRGHLAKFEDAKIRPALYRPFTKRWLLFDRILNEEVYQWENISGPAIVISDIAWRAPIFVR